MKRFKLIATSFLVTVVLSVGGAIIFGLPHLSIESVLIMTLSCAWIADEKGAAQ